MLVVLFCVITITFFLVRIAPGGPFTKERKIPPAIEKQLLARYNLDGTLWEQFTTYLGVRKNVAGEYSGLLQGDLQLSTKYRDRSVSELLAQSLPVSATLGLAAFLIATTGGIWLGSARRRAASHVDRYRRDARRALPHQHPDLRHRARCSCSSSRCSSAGCRSAAGEAGRASSCPAVTLAGPYIAYIARLMRTSMLEVLRQDFVRTARAKGLTESPRHLPARAEGRASSPWSASSARSPRISSPARSSSRRSSTSPAPARFFINSILNSRRLPPRRRRHRLLRPPRRAEPRRRYRLHLARPPHRTRMKDERRKAKGDDAYDRHGSAAPTAPLDPAVAHQLTERLNAIAFRLSPFAFPMSAAASSTRRLARLRKNPVAVAAMIVLAFIVFLAVLGPLFFRHRPARHLARRNSRRRARSILSAPMSTAATSFARVLEGARISLLVGVCGALISLVIGTTYGLISGYAGGRIDALMMRFVEILYSIPRLIILILVTFIFDPHFKTWLQRRAATPRSSATRKSSSSSSPSASSNGSPWRASSAARCSR